MDGAEIHPVGIPPVPRETVEEFEIPPGKGGDGKRQGKGRAAVHEPRPAGAAEDEAVEREDESDPKREEGVLLGGAREIEPAPSEDP